MSRHGYTDDWDYDYNLWLYRGPLERAVKGKRGQQFLKLLLNALDALPDKKLFPNSFISETGNCCALGAVARYRNIKVDDLGDANYCDSEVVGKRFGIASSMAAEIMYLNDEYLVDAYKMVDHVICGPVRSGYPDFGRTTKTIYVHNDDHPNERWQAMRQWVVENIILEG